MPLGASMQVGIIGETEAGQTQDRGSDPGSLDWESNFKLSSQDSPSTEITDGCPHFSRLTPGATKASAFKNDLIN